MSATKSTAALSSSSASRVAVIPADSCLLSLSVGCLGASTVLAAVAPWRGPPLAKVVAGVIERGRISAAGSAYSWRTGRSGSVGACRRGSFAGTPVLDRRVISTRARAGGAMAGRACKSGGVGGLTCFPGRHGDSFGSVAAWLPGCSIGDRVSQRCWAWGRHPTGARASYPLPRRQGTEVLRLGRRISMISDVWSDAPTTRL
jgi:hypothetical protein